MITKFILLTLASLSLSSCFSFGFWEFTAERKDITAQPAYEPLTKKTLKTQRDYYVRNSYIQWDDGPTIPSTVSSLELNEHQGSDALFHISKGTSFKLLKVEQVYSTEGRDSTLHYRGDYATLHFPHLQGAKLLLPITVELRSAEHIHRAPWQTDKTPTYYIHSDGQHFITSQP